MNMAVHTKGRNNRTGTENEEIKSWKKQTSNEEDDNDSIASDAVHVYMYRHGSVSSCKSLDSGSSDVANVSSLHTPSFTPYSRRFSSLTLSEFNNDGFKVALYNKLGKRGLSDGCFQNATGLVHLYSGAVLVSDMILSRISIFAENGSFRSQFSTGESSEPWDCDIMKNGTIICTLGHEHCIAMYSVDGDLIKKIGSYILERPRGISKTKENNVLVTDISLNDVMMFDFPGKLIIKLSDLNKDMKFNQPRFVTTNKYGMILVSDSGNHCIHIFTKEGKLITTFGGYGREDGKLRFPYGVVCDTEDNIYVADHYNNRVSMFTSSGTFLRHVITPEMRLKRPQGLSICNRMANELLYVTHGDLKAHEVAVYRIISDKNHYSVSINAFV